ncbi:MAG: 30S ribosome-binding factor RbfA [Treponema sp.]|jgi:ribosome-binding factor A|uniref:Ribosome-binding factor A n=1 Tax=Treponema rectale TaxID=744512 RepID=A0A840SHG7_9SPIR|nr:30S ribosome-binding factor RbfA [Treponema rectale]MBB5219598.1 ribosome-binding factor A [Treponema rectale]MBO6176056.1 30S ribosome-binding factor RbfA [Treponema sp.]
MGQYRLLRLGEQLRQEISLMLLRHEIKDPRVSEFLSIDRVEVAGDLAYAKVFVSSFMDDASVKRGVAGLQSAAGFIQCSIAKKLSVYRFPRLTFVADFSMKEGYKMVQKLNALEAESKAREDEENNG